MQKRSSNHSWMRAAALLSLLAPALISGCKGDGSSLKAEDADRIKSSKVTGQTLSPSQLQAAREEIGEKLAKSRMPDNVPQFNPAQIGRPKK